MKKIQLKMNTKFNTCGEKGFTLIELIVAMFIFGIMATGMATLMAVLIQNNDFARDMTEATTLAENKMELFKNLDYASVQPGWNWDQPEEGYWRIWEVKENVPDQGVKQITIMVVWFDSREMFHHVNLVTLKSS